MIKDLDGKVIDEKNVEFGDGDTVIVSMKNKKAEKVFHEHREKIVDSFVQSIQQGGAIFVGPGMEVSVLKKE